MPEQKEGSKLLSLKEAIKQYLRPGMKLHLAGGIGGPSAAVCEITRQYFNTRPDFELIQSTVTGHSVNLIHCNLIKKIIFSACMEISVSGHPSKVMQKAYSDNSIELENWSLLSLQQKLMAGAMGLSFMPTGSISGSTLASDNDRYFREIKDPFDDTKKIGIVKALNPDLSILHGCVSDVHGNTILSVPYGDDIWGSLASLNGVIVTVDAIVPDEVIKKYSPLVKIPSYIVKAVCLAPMGTHPFPLANPSLEIFEPYLTDEEFLHELHNASRDSQKLEDWINAWVLECRTHDDYLFKLGEERISALKKLELKKPSSQKNRKESLTNKQDKNYSTDEMLMIAASREIIESILKANHKTMLIGAGSRSVSARVAYQELRNKGYEIELISGNGQIGLTPLPGETSLQSVAGIYNTAMLTDTVTTHGVFIGGKNSRCLSVLGAGQIDKFGNINSSRTSKGDFLIGTGGANDAANANEVIVILNQSKERFVETLPYITARGDRVSKVISTMGIFTKAYGKNELTLSACFPSSEGSTFEEIIEKAESNCGWRLKRAEGIRILLPPTESELQLLRFLLAE